MLCEYQQSSLETYQLTDEQIEIIHAVATGRNILVSALAGTGKTSTLVGIAKEYPNRRGLYLAYNKNLQLEAKKKFPSYIACKTIHGLAYQDVGIPYTSQLAKKLHIASIVECLGIRPLKYQKYFSTRELIAASTNEMVKVFSYSVDEVLKPFHYSKRFLDRLTDKYGALPFNLDNIQEPKTFMEYFIAISHHYAQKLWEALCDSDNETIPANHDTYLKLYQLKKPMIQGYEYIMLDEAQDANPVILDILSHQKIQRIYVGDENQQIYGFRGTINAISTIEADKFALTQSFRFGPAIAEEANKVLKMLNAENLIRGYEPIPSKIGPVDETLPYTFIARTNAALFKFIVSKQSDSVKIHFVGDIDKVITLFESAYFLKMDKLSSITDYSLKRFASWKKFTNEAYFSQDPEYLAIINFVQDYHKNVPRVLKTIKKLCSYTEEEADIIMTTAHKAKGRQWPQVHVHDDFLSGGSPEEKNIYYVAITRAINVMDNGVKGMHEGKEVSVHSVLSHSTLFKESPLMGQQELKEEPHSNTRKTLTLKKKSLVKERESFEEVKNWLETTYPKAFDFQNPIPLKKGIRQELLAEDLPFSKVRLNKGLSGYVRSDSYLKAIIQQQWRHGLNGEQTEEILEGERDYSKQFLLFREEKKAAKKAQTRSGDDGVRNSKDDGKKKK